jgi:hypothetical protein
MEYPYRVRTIRKTRFASDTSETYHFTNWRRISRVKNFVKSRSNHVRAILVILLGVFLNVVPYVMSENLSYSLFRFDLVGTIVLCFLAGINISLISTIFSGFVIYSFFPNDSYQIYIIPNIFCSIIWSLLPRLGVTFLGSDLFKARRIFGYRYFISRVLLLSACSALASSVFMILSHKAVLQISFETTGVKLVAAQSNQLLSQMKIAAPFLSFFGSSGGTGQDYFYYLIAPLFIFEIVSYVCQISVSLTIIYLFFEWPHFRNQNERLLDRHESDSQWWNSSIILSLILIICIFLIFNLNIEFLSKVLVSFFILTTLAFLLYKSPVYTRSIDPYRNHRYRKGLFINSNKNGRARDSLYKLSYFRDGIEDLLKASAIFISILSALSLSIISFISNNTMTVELNIDYIKLSDINTIFAFNLIEITGIRYSLVIFLRIFDKH